MTSVLIFSMTMCCVSRMRAPLLLQRSYLSYFFLPEMASCYSPNFKTVLDMSEITLLLALCLILLTLFVVLTERKFLAYAQRRMGPATMGRNGFLQIGLDLIKLITKEMFLIPRPATAAAPIFLALLYASQLVYLQNFIFAPNAFITASPDSLLLYHIIFILLSNIFFSLVGLVSQSRYALLGIVRALLHAISLDIFVTLVYVLLVYAAQSVHFADIVTSQNTY